MAAFINKGELCINHHVMLQLLTTAGVEIVSQVSITSARPTSGHIMEGGYINMLLLYFVVFMFD